MHKFIHFAFQQFYTTFAWTYDAIASLVSFGEWKLWGEAALEFVPSGAHILEIAHGPGHLHVTMRRRGFNVVSLDRSPQMARQLRHRAVAHQLTLRQTLADAQNLPFADGHFDCVVSTFPAGFIFARTTLTEVRRVLAPGGRFVIVPSATFRKADAPTRLVQLAYHLTGQNTAKADVSPIRQRFETAGFAFEAHTHATPRADVVVWVCGR